MSNMIVLNQSVKRFLLRIAVIIFLGIICNESILSQISDKPFINGDTLPDAPELSERGEYKIVVRTIDIVHKDQIDIRKAKDGVAL